MKYPQIQTFLNGGLVRNYLTKDYVSDDLSLFSFDYSNEIWSGTNLQDVPTYDLFYREYVNHEIYKLILFDPIDSIKFITKLGKEKIIKFDTPTTNNKKFFSLTITQKDEYGELLTHLDDSESHLVVNPQVPFLFDRSYMTKSRLNSTCTRLVTISGSSIVDRDFTIFQLGDRFGR